MPSTHHRHLAPAGFTRHPAFLYVLRLECGSAHMEEREDVRIAPLYPSAPFS